MTSEAQVLLGVLGPIAAFLAAIALKLLDRHLKMIDKIEAANEATVKLQAQLVERLTSLETGLLHRLERVEQAIGIEDKIDEIHRQVSSPDLVREPTGRHTPLAPEAADRIPDSRPRSQAVEPASRAGTYSQIASRSGPSSRGRG